MTPVVTRIITALVIAPAVIAAVMLLETDSLRWPAALVILAGAWEWARISGLQGRANAGLYVAATAALLGISGAIEVSGGAPIVVLPVAVFWLLMSLALGIRRAVPVQVVMRPSLPVLLAGPVLLVSAWTALMATHRIADSGAMLTLFLLVMIWVADSAAFFAGRAYGRHKLAPAISPGKSVEGVVGALIAVAVLSVAGWAWMKPVAGLPVFLLLCLLVTLVSVSGDLFESLIKRRHGVKDSGWILPGHGGVLDRVDSLVAAAPVFYIGLYLAGS